MRGLTKILRVVYEIVRKTGHFVDVVKWFGDFYALRGSLPTCAKIEGRDDGPDHLALEASEVLEPWEEEKVLTDTGL